MYRVLFCLIFLSFQAFTQHNFGWVELNNEAKTYFFPNIEGIFAQRIDGTSIRCDVSEYTVTPNSLSDDHYDHGRTGCDNFISPEGEYKGNGAVYGKDANTYWQSFRRNNGTSSIQLLKKFKPCH